mgnify:CR=1 FL=1
MQLKFENDAFRFDAILGLRRAVSERFVEGACIILDQRGTVFITNPLNDLAAP